MKMEIDAARLLVWRAAWMGRTGKDFDAAEGSMSKLKAGRGRGLGDRAGDPDPRRQRLHPRVPGGADAPRRQDLHDLRGHLGDPATGDLPRDLRSADPLTERASTMSETHDATRAGRSRRRSTRRSSRGTIAQIDRRAAARGHGAARCARQILGEIFRRMEAALQAGQRAGVDAVIHWRSRAARTAARTTGRS